MAQNKDILVKSRGSIIEVYGYKKYTVSAPPGSHTT